VHLAHAYAGPLPGGPIWRAVQLAVDEGGALRDIFPSLHTAIPLHTALFLRGQSRRAGRWALLWVAQIVAATILLRWHWVTDVVAGAALALLSHRLGPALVDRWQARRATAGLPAGVYW
jgi:membrane-associated phospholipid phosphatase